MQRNFRFAMALVLVAMPTALMAQESGIDDSGQAGLKATPVPDWASISEPLTVPKDAQGAVFIRRHDSIAHLTADGTESFQSQLIRILNSQALQVGNIAITWNPAAGDARIHALRIHRGSRVIDVLESNSFEILRREGQLEQAMLDGNLTASLRVPDLRVGDDLELAFTIPIHDPTLTSTSHGMLFLADSPPLGRYRLALSWEDGQEPAIKLTDDLKQVTTRSANAVTMQFDNPDTVAPPRSAPPRYAWSRIVQYSDFSGWDEVSRRFYPLYEEASTLAADSPLREEARFIAQDHATKLEQAQAAMALVQQQVRYIYIGLNGGNYTPAAADLTWERRYGDCKGKTAMLLALLRELGIEAQGVLVANNIPNDGYEERLANPGLFDHIIVRATIDGKHYWMDGTLPAVVEARERPFFPYRSVLPLSAEGENLEPIREEPFALPQEMAIFDIDASAGFEQPANLKQTILKRGAGALQDYYAFSSVSPSQLEAALRNQLVGNSEWDSIESVSYRFNRDTQASVLTIAGTGPVDWEGEEDGSYTFTLPGGGFSPPSRLQRPKGNAKDIPYWQAPEYTCYATTVRLPEGTNLDNWGFNSIFDTSIFGRLYYRMMEIRDDRSLRLVRGSRVETSEISADRAERDNGRLEDFDNSKAVLTYDPTITMEAWGNLQPVPAADEIDWTGVDVPCLPADVLNP